jgi:DNA polymerase-3 subunit epsilon
MTGGQTALILGEDSAAGSDAAFEPVAAIMRPRGLLRVLRASEEELVAHERMLTTIDKSSGGKTIWKQLTLLQTHPAAAPTPVAAAPAMA